MIGWRFLGVRPDFALGTDSCRERLGGAGYLLGAGLGQLLDDLDEFRMLQAGVCGTDREIGSFQYGTPPAGSEFLVLGHEALGEVMEVGPDVTAFNAGDLAVPMVRHPCPHDACAPCREGRQDFNANA